MLKIKTLVSYGTEAVIQLDCLGCNESLNYINLITQPHIADKLSFKAPIKSISSVFQ